MTSMTGGETYEGYLYEPDISEYPQMSANMEDEPNSSGPDTENLARTLERRSIRDGESRMVLLWKLCGPED